MLVLALQFSRCDRPTAGWRRDDLDANVPPRTMAGRDGALLQSGTENGLRSTGVPGVHRPKATISRRDPSGRPATDTPTGNLHPRGW